MHNRLRKFRFINQNTQIVTSNGKIKKFVDLTFETTNLAIET